VRHPNLEYGRNLLIPILLLMLIPASVAFGQTYSARTDLTFQGYPSPLPAPGPACTPAAQGCFVGAGYAFTPSDFNTQIVRVTDRNTYTPNPQRSFAVCCGGSAEENTMDSSDSVIIVVDSGGNLIPMTFNASGPSVSQRYPSPYTASFAASIFFSFTRPMIGYGVCINGSNNPYICQFDFTSTTTGPTVANGKVTSLVDLSTCAPALAGVGGGVWIDDVGVSADDQTFQTSIATTPGQGSSGATYVIVWNRTNGCRVWNTNTNTITGNYGGAPTGAVNFHSNGVSAVFTGSFTIHNNKLGKGGTWAKVACQSCAVQDFYWNINTLEIYELWNDSTGGGGHTAIGYTNTLNQGSTSAGGNTYHNQSILIRPTDNTGSFTFLPCPSTGSCWPPTSGGGDGHISWNNDDPSDTAVALFTSSNNQFAPNYAWDNEILGYPTTGNSSTYRFAHTYSSGASWNFNAKNAIGNVSADGKYYLWSTDWDGMLGNTDGVSSSCSIGSNCRADVFVAILPQGNTGGPAPPTGLSAVVQ